MSFHVREKYLFLEEDFTGHSGDELHWKIECEALFPTEWKCIARMIMEHEKRPFCAAIGIPRGGVELGRHLNEYATGNYDHPYLICDDVLTTGNSFNEFADEYFKENKPSVLSYFGWVVFSRGEPQHWVKSLFQMPYK